MPRRQRSTAIRRSIRSRKVIGGTSTPLLEHVRRNHHKPAGLSFVGLWSGCRNDSLWQHYRFENGLIEPKGPHGFGDN